MITCIALDIDGTLISDDNKVSPGTIKTLNSIDRGNCTIALVTGRHYREAEFCIKALGFNTKDIIVCCDGVYIFDASGNCLCRNDTLTADDVKFICDSFSVDYVYAYSDSNNYVFYRTAKQHIIRMLRKLLLRTGEKVVSACSRTEPIEKIAFPVDYADEKTVNKLRGKYTIHIDGNVCEILAFGVNKYNALAQLEASGKIRLTETLYCGDSDNDIECFMNLENTVAPDNACPQIKALAKYHTASNNDDGIGIFLNDFFKKYIRSGNE